MATANAPASPIIGPDPAGSGLPGFVRDPLATFRMTMWPRRGPITARTTAPREADRREISAWLGHVGLANRGGLPPARTA